jgi:hypothetical protein
VAELLNRIRAHGHWAYGYASACSIAALQSGSASTEEIFAIQHPLQGEGGLMARLSEIPYIEQRIRSAALSATIAQPRSSSDAALHVTIVSA